MSIAFGTYWSHLFQKTPRRMLYTLTYYKQAAKWIGNNKRVLDIGCNEGVGSYLLGKECGFCKGIDFDEGAIQAAQANFQAPCIEFASHDFIELDPQGLWDAAVSFDVIEHIYKEHVPEFLGNMARLLTPNGVAVIATPTLVSDQYANPHTREGHVNLYTAERLQKELLEVFEYAFVFSANDEMVHTGFSQLAHSYLALACKPRR